MVAMVSATGFTPLFLHSGDHPLMPTAMLQRSVSMQMGAVEKAVELVKIALEEAQANLSRTKLCT